MKARDHGAKPECTSDSCRIQPCRLPSGKSCQQVLLLHTLFVIPDRPDLSILNPCVAAGNQYLLLRELKPLLQASVLPRLSLLDIQSLSQACRATRSIATAPSLLQQLAQVRLGLHQTPYTWRRATTAVHAGPATAHEHQQQPGPAAR